MSEAFADFDGVFNHAKSKEGGARLQSVGVSVCIALAAFRQRTTKGFEMAKTADPKKKDDDQYIFRASIRLKDGRILYAHKYGLQGFKIRVRPDNDNKT